MFAAQRLLAALLVSIGLTACGGGERESKEPMEVKDTALGDMVGTQDRARAVEETTLQHKQEIDRALEDAERGR